MAIDPFRWALPHKGPPDHLTTLEYLLRQTVFGLIAFVVFLPTGFVVLVMCYGGFIAIPFYLAASGAMTGEFKGFHPGEKEFLIAGGIIWMMSIVSLVYLNKRYLTPR